MERAPYLQNTSFKGPNQLRRLAEQGYKQRKRKSLRARTTYVDCMLSTQVRTMIERLSSKPRALSQSAHTQRILTQ